MANLNDSDSDFELNLGLSDSDVLFSDTSEESSSSDTEQYQNTWKTGDHLTSVPKTAFTGPTPGTTADINPSIQEIDFLKLFFTDDIIDIVVSQTNLYAQQQQARHGRDENWVPVTMEEFRAWLGIRVFMSWSEDYLFGGHSVAAIMKRDRINKISQYLHVADSSTNVEGGLDKLHKIRPVLETVRDMCRYQYNPHQNISIDEAMVAFRGRLAFRQYLPAKPTKYGIKVWMRADPENGYVSDFQVYTGKENRTAEAGLGSRVVMDMISGVDNRHHIVNCDNYFMSPQLCPSLLDVGTYARGTVRCNRKDFRSSILHYKCVKNQGDMVVTLKGDLVAVAWKDKKVVNLLSTADVAADISSAVSRKTKDGTAVQIPCPTVMKHYMNCADRANQIRTELSTYRTSKKWWNYLFWFAFEVAIAVAVTNALVLMRDSQSNHQMTKPQRTKPRTMLQFCIALSKQLIGQFQQCSKTGKRRDIKCRCSSCDVFLCIDCFETYHKDLFQGR
ncbi:piggyBac transposable element-derived protein 4-like [Haliotis asinina]|uniref:piggyBac transposable element-derived protein 4-like n=1 Tax=Haliotis asinina TaxID=109174 RepID=UPI003531E7CD